jgi:uncharacterized protein involved in exopolysaccharide biosynthesis
MDKSKKEKMPEDEIRLKDLVSIFLRKKWIFLSFFLVVLIAGLLFTFLKVPQYQAYSTLKLKGVYYDENLYKYFPEEAKKLGIFAPEMDVKELESLVLNDITKSLREDVLLEDVAGKLDFKINKEELNKKISTLVDSSNKVIRIIVTYNDADGAFQINNTLINAYIESSKKEKSEIIENVISEIDNRITSLQEQYEEEHEGTGFKNDEKENLEYDLDSINSLIVDMNKIKYNLENNKEVYTSNVEIVQEPSVPSEPVNADNVKSILVTIFAAIAVGLIAIYMPCVFTSFKKH